MRKKIKTILAILLIFSLAACSVNTAATDMVTATQQSLNEMSSNTENTTSSGSEATTAVAASDSVTESIAGKEGTHDDPSDYIWEDQAVVPITLNGSSIEADSSGVEIQGSTATITAAGTYEISGTLTDGQIIVDTKDEEIVRLILNGAEIHNSSTSPIFIADAEKAMIVLAANSSNIISDGSAYVFENADEDEPNAAIFSKADLTLSGDGALTVSGNYNDGIASKDGLIIAGGTIHVQAIDDGIRGKDYLIVKDGSIIVDSQGDGLKSDNADDVGLGYIAIQAGSIQITSQADAIQAESDVLVSGGVIDIVTAGGSGTQISEDLSAKGIKGALSVVIDGGTFTVDAADDAIHSNGNIVINGGDFSLSTGDDGMHADQTLTVNSGYITVSDSYEGLESALITINGGEIRIKSSDDGINVAGGNDGSGMVMGGAFPGGAMPGALQPGEELTDAIPPGGTQPEAGMPGGTQPEAGMPGGMQPGGGGRQGGGMPGGFGGGLGMDSFNYSGDYYLYINGGTVLIDADGDGIDSNGAIEMTGGVVVVNGPTQQMNGALDYIGTFNLNGGTIIAAGSAGMAMAASQTSTQNSVLINFSSTLAAGSLVHIENSAGEGILTFAVSKATQSLMFSSAALKNGSYTVYVGGSSTGEVTNGIYQNGTYTAGERYGEFTVSSTITQVGGRTR